MAKNLRCPCGLEITELDDDFVEAVNAHLVAEHVGRSYPATMILDMAQTVPDDEVAV